jgi:hypothetical protein
MADCERKECYERTYESRKPTVTSVGGVAAAGLAAAVKTAAEGAITAKARAPKVVGCGDEGCECVGNGKPDTPWGDWKLRPVNTTVDVAGVAQAVIGTVERRSRRTKQGDCDDPGALLAFGPGEWDIELVAVRPGKPTKKGKRT